MVVYLIVPNCITIFLKRSTAESRPGRDVGATLPRKHSLETALTSVRIIHFIALPAQSADLDGLVAGSKTQFVGVF
jgi:hypothetical protein